MKQKKNNVNLFYRFNIGVFIVSGMLLVAGSVLPGLRSVVLADQYDTQINALRQQNASTQGVVNGLVAQANNYQDAISKLQSQIDILQAGIDSNLAQQASLQQQITDAQNEIDKQRAILATDVKSMYVDGTPSTLEMLATSKNLSDFVDKQEYRTSVQNKLQDTLKRIAALQKQLQEQKVKVDILLKDLNNQQSQLGNARAQQANLLALNQDQQAAYNAQLSANNARITSLEAQQRAAYTRLTGSNGRSAVGSPVQYKNMTAPQNCGGGYRYCWTSYLDQPVSDPWGFGYARECVHYVLSSLANQSNYIPAFPAGGGNAYNWVPFTTSVGAATLVSLPQPGDVVYIPIAPLGHVAMVDYVNGDGTVHVSQYNWYPGKYNTMDLYLSSPGIQFLRFH
ncbi:MAG: CHAP domain-containing protein [Candidatus Saccharimonadales bacterium]